jgi:hypothetical protein
MPLRMNTTIVVNGCGIIHIAYRVHALSIVIKMLATSELSRRNAVSEHSYSDVSALTS